MELKHFFFFLFLSKFNIDDTEQPHNKTIKLAQSGIAHTITIR